MSVPGSVFTSGKATASLHKLEKRQGNGHFLVHIYNQVDPKNKKLNSRTSLSNKHPGLVFLWTTILRNGATLGLQFETDRDDLSLLKI